MEKDPWGANSRWSSSPQRMQHLVQLLLHTALHQLKPLSGTIPACIWCNSYLAVPTGHRSIYLDIWCNVMSLSASRSGMQRRTIPILCPANNSKVP
jgi:hypothetical protein